MLVEPGRNHRRVGRVLHSIEAFRHGLLFRVEFLSFGLALFAIGLPLGPIFPFQEGDQKARVSASRIPRRAPAFLPHRLVKVPTAVDGFPSHL
jgi:hypothetical protein